MGRLAAGTDAKPEGSCGLQVREKSVQAERKSWRCSLRSALRALNPAVARSSTDPEKATGDDSDEDRERESTEGDCGDDLTSTRPILG